MNKRLLTGADASGVLLSVTQSVVVFTALLPPFGDVRKAGKGDIDTRKDVRLGEAAAATLVLGIGMLASGVAGSSAPVIASVICALVLIAMYESVLNN
jgi:hypothetical protein